MIESLSDQHQLNTPKATPDGGADTIFYPLYTKQVVHPSKSRGACLHRMFTQGYGSALQDITLILQRYAQFLTAQSTFMHGHFHHAMHIPYYRDLEGQWLNLCGCTRYLSIEQISCVACRFVALHDYRPSCRVHPSRYQHRRTASA